MPRVLVTGAAGFIGSHTVDQLLAAGHIVCGVDNFRTGRIANLTTAASHPQFTFQELDVADAPVFEALAARFAPEAIVHLAALVSVPESITDPALNYRLNLQATHIVAEAARKHGARRIVFASSAAVYGDVAETPTAESAVKNPISPYGAAKLASEIVLLGHAGAFGLTVRCQRYFNVYGPRQDPRSLYSGVISIFCQKLGAAAVPVIFGDGGQTRDFISVHDVARANVIAATHPAVRSGVANICTGKPASLNELVTILRRHFDGAPEPVHGPARDGDIRHSLGHPEIAGIELGFFAEVSLADGLAELVRTR
jgi:UDP-glucose 4-epimerase